MASSLPVAIVTGTNSGLGLALVVRLASTHKVYAGMRGVSSAKREALDAAVSGAGLTANVVVIELDVNSDDSVNTAVEKAIAESGRCDILVNNAGFSVFGSVEMVPMEKMHSQMNTNVLGVIRCIKAVLPSMRKQKAGKIINISSIGGVWGQPFNDIYCASKFALEGLAEAQAPLFRQFGVTVTNVQPGAITSDFVNNAARPDPASIPAEYMPGIQSTMAAYAAARENAGNSQTPDEVAKCVMDQVVLVEKPPLKVQTNTSIQRVFEMQNKDTTGESGVAVATSRFLTPPSATAAVEEKANISLTYWPPMGRSLSIVLMLEDSGVAYKRVDYTGGALPDPSVVAVPSVEVSGNHVSQTMAIMEFLGDELGYLPPSKAHNKSLQCMYNIYDIVQQSITKRMEEIKTKPAANEFVNARAAQFYTAVEAGYKEFPGSLYCGDKPCMVDFQLLASVIGLKAIFGDTVVSAMLDKVAPTVSAAVATLAARPKVKALIEAKFNGRPMYPPSMAVDASLLTE